jgi:hypothetical protein
MENYQQDINRSVGKLGVTHTGFEKTHPDG